jgi:hypothetical protein
MEIQRRAEFGKIVASSRLILALGLQVAANSGPLGLLNHQGRNVRTNAGASQWMSSV